ncbi:FecR domain-containing protein [Stenotrophomonas maltophilia]|uniref:FecR domain-containing protein n=1 Tax=Stenotrophomonas maltophilia TaxID=40324 RepID=UPI0021C75E11|nr:FecR domain-containing protein [Stenotrophomonas maltophilia]MCU1127280.1 FecR domain-containing protein [Stenotrophomonas maltophilia]
MPPETATAPALPPRVLEQAADWLMRLHEDGSAAQRARWQRWHDADPDHARAWQRAERLLALSGQVPPPLAHSALQRAPSPGRRALLRSVAALLVAPLGGWLAWRLYDDAAWDASVRTVVGERLRHVLDDGSVLLLDTDTAMDIAFDDQQRLLRLRHGQVLVETAADSRRPARPFVLASPAGRMQALGTRFNVQHADATTVVAVLEGTVRVMLAATGQQRVVDAGRQLSFHADAFASVQAIAPAVDAWRHGMLVVDAQPLRRVLEQLGRYQSGWLGCDDAIASQRVSGAFPVDDLDRAVAMLAAVHGLEIQRGPAGLWTRLRAGTPR